MIDIKLERLDFHLIDEIQMILDDNYEETSQFHQPLDIDWGMYMAIEGMFKAFVMRNMNRRVVGVLFFMVAPYPHIKTWIMAQQVTFYVEPDYRRHSLKMLNYSEKYLTEIGVDIIVQAARYNTGFCKVLDSKGYERADITYTKRLN